MNRETSYYVCNGKEFLSKMQALYYSLSVNKPVQWVFYENKFNNYDWTVEPEFSLEYYYAKRARELREKYDYLILSFSGGADTNNILETFIDNQLHLDEIIVIHHTELTKNVTELDRSVTKSTNFHAEFELQTIPRLKYIQQKLPKTKITLLDCSDNIKKALIGLEEDWVFNKEQTLQLYLRRFNLNYFKETKNQWDKGRTIGIMTGIDKPQTYILPNSDRKSKSFYVQFSDLPISIPAKMNDFKNEYDNVTLELFYWHPDCSEMISKQCHNIKKMLELNKNYQFFWSSQHFKKTNISYGDMFRLVHEKILRSLLYNNWNPEWFQSTKTLKFWYSDYDTWFRTDPYFSKQFKIWERGISLLSYTLGDYVLRRDNKPDRIIPFTCMFYLGDLNETK